MGDTLMFLLSNSEKQFVDKQQLFFNILSIY